MLLIMGGSLSVTVTVKLQVLALPEESTARQRTVVVPIGNALPDATLVEGVSAPSALSLAVTENTTWAVGLPGSVFTAIFAGHAITGGSLSVTVTVKLQVLALPEESTARHVTVFVPT